MSVCIIAEYNPFHKGHIYQLSEAKKRFPREEIVIIMSGKYVQRGEIAVASFQERKKMAIKYGASKVIELSFEHATQAAHIFAEGAIKLAAKHKITKLFFGSESNDVKNLMKIAKTIYQNQNEYGKLLKYYLKQDGNSFPKSAALALKKLVGQEITYPNDILGLEYCKAIVFNDLKIIPYTLKRTINFHSNKTNNQFASASYIRELFWSGQDYSKYTPMKLKPNQDKIENHYCEFQSIIKKSSAKELANIKMMSEGMENLFKKHIDIPTMEAFINKTNSKRYTSSRIKRTILYVIKNIKK